MPYISVHGKTHDRITLFKAKNRMKSFDECINELLDLWDVIP